MSLRSKLEPMTAIFDLAFLPFIARNNVPCIFGKQKYRIRLRCNNGCHAFATLHVNEMLAICFINDKSINQCNEHETVFMFIAQTHYS